MVETELLGRYEGNHTGANTYVIIKYESDDMYKFIWGAIGFDPTESRLVDTDQLRESVKVMRANGYQKMPDDTAVLITERPDQKFVGLRDWLTLGGQS